MFSQIEWSSGDFPRFQLLHHEIVCWRVVLDTLSNEALESLFQLLDTNEKSRAGAFIKKVDQRRYIAAHGILRILLNKILGKDAYLITSNEYGKPQVSDAQVEFNLSHSGNLILLVFTSNIPLGVDVEEARNIDDIKSIVTHHFHPSEAQEIMSCQPIDVHQTFFSCWSKKESVCKALGLGLSLPLDSFKVSCLPMLGSWTLVGTSKGFPEEWTLTAFNPLAGYFAAIAAPHPSLKVRFLNFEFPY